MHASDGLNWQNMELPKFSIIHQVDYDGYKHIVNARWQKKQVKKKLALSKLHSTGLVASTCNLSSDCSHHSRLSKQLRERMKKRSTQKEKLSRKLLPRLWCVRVIKYKEIQNYFSSKMGFQLHNTLYNAARERKFWEKSKSTIRWFSYNFSRI